MSTLMDGSGQQVPRQEHPYRHGKCPGCGRAIRIREAYLGLLITCNHCGKSFVAVATDGDAPRTAPSVLVATPSSALRSERERELEDEARALGARVADVERALAESRMAESAARDRGVWLDAKLGELERQLEEERERRARDVGELDAVRKARVELEAEVRVLREAADVLRAERDRAELLARERDAALREREQARAEAAEVRRALEAARAESEASRQELGSARAELAATRARLEETEQARAEAAVSARQACADLERQLVESLAAYDADRRALTEAADRERRAVIEESRRLARELAEEREERGRLEAEVACLEDRRGRVDAEVKRLRDERERARRACSDRDREHESMRRERDELRARMSTSEAERERLAQEIAGARSRVAELEASCDALEKRAVAERAEGERLRGELSAIERAMDAARRDAERALDREVELRERAERLEAERDELERALRWGREASDRLVADLEVERASGAALELELRKAHRMIEYLYHRLESQRGHSTPAAAAEGWRVVDAGPTSAPGSKPPQRRAEESGQVLGEWTMTPDPLAAELHARIARSVRDSGGAAATRGATRGRWFRGRRGGNDPRP